MIRINQVNCTSETEIKDTLLRKLNMPEEDLLSWKIHRRSVDARRHRVFFSYIIDAKVRHEKKYLKKKDVYKTPDEKDHFQPSGTIPLKNRPVVAGFGPAGMFAALYLARFGYKPLVIERGSRPAKRKKDVEAYWKEGRLDPESNVQFGAGGAGAFSDGKLTTRSKDVIGRYVLQALVDLGAQERILIDQHPHIGTDGFLKIIEACIQEIEDLGGTFLFDERLDDLVTVDDHLEAVVLKNGETIPAQALIAALGHSAHDSIQMLHEKGVHMENKPFAVGVRIEHLQTFINEAMLGQWAQDESLIPARYQLTYKADNGKGVYSFCMCPGGYVIASSSDEDGVVVNGMSYADRAGQNANAALLVQVDESDYGDELFAGLDYQRQLEKAAFIPAQPGYAPAQLARDYLAGRISGEWGKVQPTLQPGVVFRDLNELFSAPVNAALHEALDHFEKQVPGFVSEDALLCGVESRSSCAVRIVRDKLSRMASVYGIFPAGEGSGYAGGIMTSAIDGIRSAQALMSQFAPWEGEKNEPV